jgi:hypothetical protein
MPSIPALRVCLCRVAAAALSVVVGAIPALSGPSDLCTQAARDASDRIGVPYEVLLAITLVETGQSRNGTITPWPWTINSAGEGHWFDALAEAEAHVQGLLDQGVTNIDLGCFQLNYRWHAQNFATLSDMLDPAQNAEYAARYLSDLRDRTGDWGSAAAAYHSATPEYAARYRLKFDAAYAALGSGEVLLAEAEISDRTNGFPLLVAGRHGQFGSLVPSTDGAGPLFGSN